MSFPPGWLAADVGLAKGFLFVLVILLALRLRRRPQDAGAAALVFASAATGLWVLALGRPWGLLIDPDATRRSAEIALTASTGAPSLLGGIESSGGLLSALARVVPSASLLMGLLHVLPVLCSALFVLTTVLAGRGEASVRGVLAILASTLAFSDLDSISGSALPSVAWSHPRGALVALLALGSFGMARRSGRASIETSMPTAVLGIGSMLARPPVQPAGGDVLTAALALWPLALLAALAREKDLAACRAAVASSLAAVALAAAGLGLQGFPVARGLWLISLAPALASLLARLVERASLHPACAGLRLNAPAALLLLLAPVTAPFWWRPTALDPVTEGSLEPLSRTVTAEMQALASLTKPEDVIVASEEMAPFVVAIAGRRVLRVPGLESPPDDADRRAIEFTVLRGRAGARALKRFGVTHVLAAPGDFVDLGLAAPEDLETRPGFTLVREGAARFRLYRVTPPASANSNP